MDTLIHNLQHILLGVIIGWLAGYIVAWRSSDGFWKDEIRMMSDHHNRREHLHFSPDRLGDKPPE